MIDGGERKKPIEESEPIDREESIKRDKPINGGKTIKESNRYERIILIRFLDIPEMGNEIVGASAELEGEDFVDFNLLN